MYKQKTRHIILPKDFLINKQERNLTNFNIKLLKQFKI